MSPRDKFVVYTVLAANGFGLANNFIFAVEPAKWLRSVPVSISPNSTALYSLQFQATTTLVTVPTNVASYTSRSVMVYKRPDRGNGGP
jgi:hypothetical protein